MNRFWHIVTWVVQTGWLTLLIPVLKIFGRLKVEGYEKIKNLPKRNYMFVCNHVTELDVVMFPASLYLTRFMPMFFASLPQKHYQGRGFQGKYIYTETFLKIFGGYPVYKGTGDYNLALRNHSALLEKGRDVCIFAEGKLSQKGLRQGRAGASFLLHRTKVPIIPVVIKGFYGKKVSLKGLFTGKYKITIEYGDLITYEDIFPEDPKIEEIENQKEFFEERTRRIMKSHLNMLGFDDFLPLQVKIK